MASLAFLAVSAWCFWLWARRRHQRRLMHDLQALVLLQQAEPRRTEIVVTVHFGELP